jgi:hypothetical protein
MPDFASSVHLLGRYPELARSEGFLRWFRLNDGNVWHETHADEQGYLTVIVQSSSRLLVFAALLRRNEPDQNGTIEHEVVRTAEFDVSENLARSAAVGAVRRETGASTADVQAVRPVVNFSSSEPALSWEVELRHDEDIQTFVVRTDSNVEKKEVRTAKKAQARKPLRPMIDLIPPMSDWLSENECHHLSQWRPTAQQWAQGGSAAADRAFRIWLRTRQTMAYDLNITHISEFTWSDTLTINRNGWRGICDEWAVIQVTMLRAVGIPAVLKFLIWQQGGQGVGHACLEWSDNGVWRHMDALWNAFDNRAIYRQNGAQNVTVMDADFPLDSRYNGSAWGVPDVPGDQMFYPYGDFIISPSYPGSPRPGYSY